MRFLKYLLCSLFLLAAASAHAEDVVVSMTGIPWNSMKRITVSARAEHARYDGRQGASLPFHRSEISGGIAGAYYIVPNLTATAAVLYGIDNRLFQYRIGLSIKLFDGMTQGR